MWRNGIILPEIPKITFITLKKKKEHNCNNIIKKIKIKTQKNNFFIKKLDIYISHNNKNFIFLDTIQNIKITDKYFTLSSDLIFSKKDLYVKFVFLDKLVENCDGMKIKITNYMNKNIKYSNLFFYDS
jgi:hypothetical protein